AATDIDAVTVDCDPPGQQRRIVIVLERCLEKAGGIERGRRTNQQLRRDRGRGEAEALGAFVRGNADALSDMEQDLESAAVDDGFALLRGEAARGLHLWRRRHRSRCL